MQQFPLQTDFVIFFFSLNGVHFLFSKKKKKHTLITSGELIEKNKISMSSNTDDDLVECNLVSGKHFPTKNKAILNRHKL